MQIDHPCYFWDEIEKRRFWTKIYFPDYHKTFP